LQDFEIKEGPLLHRKLLELNEENPTSWLEGWWDAGYLEQRDPIPINTNPCFVFGKPPGNQVQMSTSKIHLFSWNEPLS
jgi:hypothetical protein